MSRQVRVRDVVIGGGAPVSIQSMTNVDARNERGILEQIARLKDVGCEILRLAVPDREGLEVFGRVRKKTDMPLVADIHFDYRLAVGAIEAGADKIRINPGNIGSDDRVRAVAKAALEHQIPIRVGVNAGSLEKGILEKNGGVTAAGLAESALRSVERMEEMGMEDLVVSIKASDVAMTYDAHKIAVKKTDHPFHIGITEAGTVRRGRTKSAAGLGALLLAGIGDTVRVSLTADPCEEVLAAREILEVIGLRKPKYDLVSCPTCGRTRIDLETLAEEVDGRLASMPDIPEGLKVAVMGCVVNGPGEGAEADFGCCGGDGKGMIIARGEVIKTVREEELAEELIRTIRNR